MARQADIVAQQAAKATKRRLQIEEAEFRLRREIERQDTARYRDWTKLVEAVLEGLIWSAE